MGEERGSAPLVVVIGACRKTQRSGRWEILESISHVCHGWEVGQITCDGHAFAALPCTDGETEVQRVSPLRAQSELQADGSALLQMVIFLGHVPRDGAAGLKVTRIFRPLTQVAKWPLGSPSASHTLGGWLGGYGREKPLRKLSYTCGRGPGLLGTPAIEELTCMDVSLALPLLSVGTQPCEGQSHPPGVSWGPCT